MGQTQALCVRGCSSVLLAARVRRRARRLRDGCVDKRRAPSSYSPRMPSARSARGRPERRADLPALVRNTVPPPLTFASCWLPRRRTATAGIRLPTSLAVDSEAGSAYWTGWGERAIMRCGIDGGKLEWIGVQHRVYDQPFGAWRWTR